MRNTQTVRLYRDDVQEVKMRFPKISSADFFHIAVRTNPLLQIENILRGKNVKK